MRQVDWERSEKTSARVIQVAYVPNMETVGRMWFEDGTLYYAENEFALNRLGSLLRSWAMRLEMVKDSQEFVDTVAAGGTGGWRWVFEEPVQTLRGPT